MSRIISIHNRQRRFRFDPVFFTQILQFTLQEGVRIPACEIAVFLVGASEMAKINRKFLDHEGPTDVITFPYSDPVRPGDTVMGDIFVCPDIALEQARQFHVPWQNEVARYAVHGILHLLGYDDLHSRARRRMKSRENRLVKQIESKFSLRKLGVAPKLNS